MGRRGWGYIGAIATPIERRVVDHEQGPSNSDQKNKTTQRTIWGDGHHRRVHDVLGRNARVPHAVLATPAKGHKIAALELKRLLA